jgi:hypothetical protein
MADMIAPGTPDCPQFALTARANAIALAEALVVDP